MTHLIELKNICKFYKTGTETVKALNNVSLEIDSGELVAIVGQSGSGKSTLMNILGCLDTATGGSYILGGKDITEYSEKELSIIRNRQIGFIFQSFNLIPTLNAIENVELPLVYRGLSKTESRKLAVEALYMVGLGERMYHRPKQLSGGQQQRVAIARAIASKPPIILADEPTGNLDKSSAKDVIKLLLELNKKGKTLIFITHDNTLASLAPRRINISDGQIVEKELVTSKNHKIWRYAPKGYFHLFKKVQNI